MIQLGTVRANRAIVLSLVAFMIALGVFAPLTPRALVNGDAAVYAQQIESRNFSSRTTHVGFYLLGSLLSRVLPRFSDYAFNLMNAVLAAASLAVVAALTHSLLRAALSALLAPLFLLANLVIVENALYAEVYFAQAFFLLLALGLWQSGRSIPSAGSFAVSALISPSSVFAIPSFAILRPHLKSLAVFAVTAAAIVSMVIVPVYQDFFFGGRGLVKAASTESLGPIAILKEAYEVVFGYFCLLPLVIVGLWKALKRVELLNFAVATLSLWLFSFLLGEKFKDVPVQLPFYLLLGLFAALGADHLVRVAADETAAGRTRVFRWIWGTSLGSMLPVILLAVVRSRVRRLDQLPEPLTTLFLGLLAVGGLLSILAARSGRPPIAVRCLLVTMLTVNCIFVFLMITAKTSQLERYRETVLAIGRLAAPESVAVGGWSQGILFNHYLNRTAYSDQWIDEQWLEGAWGAERERAARSKWAEALRNGDEVWVLGEYPDLSSELEDHGYIIERFLEVYRARRRDAPIRPGSGVSGELDTRTHPPALPEPESSESETDPGEEDSSSRSSAYVDRRVKRVASSHRRQPLSDQVRASRGQKR